MWNSILTVPDLYKHQCRLNFYTLSVELVVHQCRTGFYLDICFFYWLFHWVSCCFFSCIHIFYIYLNVHVAVSSSVWHLYQETLSLCDSIVPYRCRGCKQVTLGWNCHMNGCTLTLTHTHIHERTCHLLTWPGHIPLGVTDLGKRSNLSSSLSCLTPLCRCPSSLLPLVPGVEGQDKWWHLLSQARFIFQQQLASFSSSWQQWCKT